MTDPRFAILKKQTNNFFFLMKILPSIIVNSIDFYYFFIFKWKSNSSAVTDKSFDYYASSSTIDWYVIYHQVSGTAKIMT